MIYIAGPLSATPDFTVEDNIAAACEAFLLLSRNGVPSFCPHLAAFVPGAFNVPYERWIEIDLAILERCDVVLMLPRWETSLGARREHELAITRQKRVIYDIQELL